ncbi:uvrD/REP helicase N-terminal domain protein [Mycobacterium ulcerans str. Harvey]|uniref:UvrD/REP helicase N-terminal domain protein n=1 Tax=Mycobacterium ulcerans str. Harvey TaxID=1299332 RepID=A0ABN0R5C3_MYCUL|nr:uvrD/REP helicase N-terminal domain protein [Mycobacterium ulcerans str. Harvey]
MRRPDPGRGLCRFRPSRSRRAGNPQAASGILGYDDLLLRLADALASEDSAARARMQQRWPVVMVDEFQDTDAVQWQVIDSAFSGRCTLILIGDPKQAIYAFRGGDIVTYLHAAQTAGDKRTLATNWRSDSALVDRLQVVLRGAELGDPAIVVRDVKAHHQGHRLAGAPHNDALRLRVVRRATLGRRGIQNLPIDILRDHIGRDLASDIGALLASGATFAGRALQANDIAVIVEKHKDARACHRALTDAGIHAVYTGDTDVFSSEAADDWLALLEAFDQPHRPGSCAPPPRRCSSARPPTILPAAAMRSPIASQRPCGSGRTTPASGGGRHLRGRAVGRYERPRAVVAGGPAAHDRPGPRDAAAAEGLPPGALYPSGAARLAARPARGSRWRYRAQPPDR